MNNNPITIESVHTEYSDIQDSNPGNVVVLKGRRGRPRKVDSTYNTSIKTSHKADTESQAKRPYETVPSLKCGRKMKKSVGSKNFGKKNGILVKKNSGEILMKSENEVRRGRPSIEFTQEMKEEIYYYARSGLNFENMCNLLNVSPRWAHHRLKENPEAYVLYKIGAYKANADVSGWLYENCKPKYRRVKVRDNNGKLVKDENKEQVYEMVKSKEGNVIAQMFWLKSRAGWRDRGGQNAEPESIGTETKEFINLTDNERKTLTEIFAKIEGNKEILSENLPN
jgi:hypothetical protein